MHPRTGAPIFIVGPSRSGTSLLRSALRAHPELDIAHETHYFDDLRPRLAGLPAEEARAAAEAFFVRVSGGSYTGTGSSARPLTLDALRAEIAAVDGDGPDACFHAYCSLLAARSGAVRWGEKTPRHVFRLPEIFAAHPDAQVVCMVRDPRGVVASYRHWRTAGAEGASPAEARERTRVRDSYDPVIVSAMWRSAVGAGERARSTYGDRRVRLLRFEDIVTEPEHHLRDLAAWLGVRFVADMLDVPVSNSSFEPVQPGAGVRRAIACRWREKLSPAEVAVVQSCCRGGMRRHGYAPVRTAARPDHVARLFARAPASARRALRSNGDRREHAALYLARRIRSLTR